jgi:hypothetical protein
MPPAEAPDHDQRLKVMLKEFIEQFFLCFFADWAQRFDFGDVTWLDKELFLAPPQGRETFPGPGGPTAGPAGHASAPTGRWRADGPGTH